MDTDPGQPIYFQEAGYSSGSTFVGGSMAAQKEYVKEMFRVWDQYPNQIKAISFLNLHEWKESSLDGFGVQYGMCPGTYCNPFKEYLRTLGLRTNSGDGADKPAFTELINQTQVRNW